MQILRKSVTKRSHYIPRHFQTLSVELAAYKLKALQLETDLNNETKEDIDCSCKFTSFYFLIYRN